jgi:hypothetical protein
MDVENVSTVPDKILDGERREKKRARIQAYPNCRRLLERFMSDIVTPLFSQTENIKALGYIKKWTEQVTYSKDPESHIDKEPRNPIDAFAKWVAVALDPKALQKQMQALYDAVGYVAGKDPEIEPPDGSYSQKYGFKYTFAVYVLHWMVARDPLLRESDKKSIQYIPNIGVLSQIEAAYDYIQDPPYATGSPSYNTDSPSYNTDSPPYATGSPSYNTDSPSYAPGSPSYNTDSPSHVPTTPTDAPPDATLKRRRDAPITQHEQERQSRQDAQTKHGQERQLLLDVQECIKVIGNIHRTLNTADLITQFANTYDDTKIQEWEAAATHFYEDGLIEQDQIWMHHFTTALEKCSLLMGECYARLEQHHGNDTPTIQALYESFENLIHLSLLHSDCSALQLTGFRPMPDNPFLNVQNYHARLRIDKQWAITLRNMAKHVYCIEIISTGHLTHMKNYTRKLMRILSSLRPPAALPPPAHAPPAALPPPTHPPPAWLHPPAALPPPGTHTIYTPPPRQTGAVRAR